MRPTGITGHLSSIDAPGPAAGGVLVGRGVREMGPSVAFWLNMENTNADGTRLEEVGAAGVAEAGPEGGRYSVLPMPKPTKKKTASRSAPAKGPGRGVSRTARAGKAPARGQRRESKALRERRETEQTHERFPTVSRTDVALSRAFAVDAARMLADDKCEDVVLLDVSGMSQMSDFIVVASGTSDRQMRSAADDVAKLGNSTGWTCFRQHADDRTTWVALDFVDVMVHVFEPNTRAHYDLEMLWADAPRVAWERPDQVKRDRAGVEA